MERLGELILPPGALQINDQLARHGQRGTWSLVLFDQREREINSRGNAGRRVELPILDVERVGVDAELGKAVRHVLAGRPVCRDASSVETWVWAERINGSADACSPLAVWLW